MALSGNYASGQVTIGTSATLIQVVPAVDGGVLIANTGASTVYLGGPSVVATAGASQGYPLTAGTSVNIPASGSLDNSLYAIVASGSSTVNFLYAASVF
jgi:hypothetical protein